ncbi:MAG: hypothetical protein F9K24_21785 [Leptonema illini]|uniref:Lipoprotein n=1 Tax=Leptonema illini TaxID=183 RepID=A0A833LWX9_9LEPT|nr:MAG: hypothetical protein F9K24_21785 [Leptonema illini]
MKSALLRTLFLVGALSAGLLSGCTKEPPVKPEILKKHGPAAKAFCEQIVECEREEMRQRLADDVQRRTYLEGRMTDAACIEAQLRRIEERPDSVEAMVTCTPALSEASDCKARLLLLRAHESCRSALNL